MEWRWRNFLFFFEEFRCWIDILCQKIEPNNIAQIFASYWSNSSIKQFGNYLRAHCKAFGGSRFSVIQQVPHLQVNSKFGILNFRHECGLQIRRKYHGSLKTMTLITLTWLKSVNSLKAWQNKHVKRFSHSPHAHLCAYCTNGRADSTSEMQKEHRYTVGKYQSFAKSLPSFTSPFLQRNLYRVHKVRDTY